MTTLYRVIYKIVEPGKHSSGVRIVERPIHEYAQIIRKEHPDATIIHLELIEEFESREESETARESIIILGLDWT